MRLSTKGRYAVMAMVDLAGHGSGAPVTLAEIAERQEISLCCLEQPFAKLRRFGLVKNSPFGCRGNGSRCHTHDLWEERGSQIRRYLNSVSLADVCERRVRGAAPVVQAAESA